jgi:hypothetical protein
LARVPGTTVWWPPSHARQGEHEPGVLVFAPAAPLNFTNVERVCADLKSALARKQPPVQLLVIETSGMIDIDYTGSQKLQQAIAEFKTQDIAIALARLSDERVQHQALRSGLVGAIGEDRVFLSVEDAVRKLGPGPRGSRPRLPSSNQYIAVSERPLPGAAERRRNDRAGEGFRMPSGVRKPPIHEPAGLRRRSMGISDFADPR